MRDPRSPALALLALVALAACRDAAGKGDAPLHAASAEAPPASAAPSARAPADGAADKIRAELSFVRDGKPVLTLTRAALTAAVPTETFTAYDPYYRKPKTFRALPLKAVLEHGFGEPAASLVDHDFVLRAMDGYTVPLPGSKLLEKGSYLAIADVEVPGWEPIGPGRADPGPYYLVWRETSQYDLDTHPRPWQLVTIEIAPFEATFPHAVPAGVARDAPAARGFRIFREQCISCHAINREGGRVGPDLNVPRSIVEYRPLPQIRAYIRDPRAFRYSNMPAHPGLGDADLEALIAYFNAMKDRKYDPDATHGGP